MAGTLHHANASDEVGKVNAVGDRDNVAERLPKRPERREARALPTRPAAARVPREVVRKLRAAIKNRELGRPGKGEETLAQLKGLAAFVCMVDPDRGRTFLDRIAALEAVSGGA